MHFWNKLSTAALMRLTILVSLNLIMGRLVGGWSVVLHPLFFLSVVTIDLGLYAVMVYSGTLNRTLIAMMLAGLVGVLAFIAYVGADSSAFVGYGGRFGKVAMWIEGRVSDVTDVLRTWGVRIARKSLWWQNGIKIAYIVIDVVWSGVILAVGLLARALQARSQRRDTPAPRPSP